MINGHSKVHNYSTIIVIWIFCMIMNGSLNEVKCLIFRLIVGTGTTNGMQVFHSLICSDETLVTSACTSNPVLKSHSTYSVENYIVSSSILSALFGEWKNYVWCFFSTLKDLRDLDKKLDLLTPIMTKTEFLLTILFNIKQKSHENKEQCQLNNY